MKHLVSDHEEKFRILKHVTSLFKYSLRTEDRVKNTVNAPFGFIASILLYIKQLNI